MVVCQRVSLGSESGEWRELVALLASIDLEFRGFEFEGAVAGLVPSQSLCQNRFQQFLHGPGERHTYSVHVGAGWAYARLPRLRMRIRAAIGAHHPLLRRLAVDGLGFLPGR